MRARSPGLDDLRPDAERALEPDRFLEPGTHRRGDADDDAASDVAGLAAHNVAEALEDGEGAHDHLAVSGVG